MATLRDIARRAGLDERGSVYAGQEVVLSPKDVGDLMVHAANLALAMNTLATALARWDKEEVVRAGKTLSLAVQAWSGVSDADTTLT